MKIEVVIIGGGLLGFLLLQLLNKFGVEIVILEWLSCDYVLLCICVGVFEVGIVDMLYEVGVGDWMEKEGILYEGCYLIDDDLMVWINFFELMGKKVMVYGQIEVIIDLYVVQDVMGINIIYGVEDVVIDGLEIMLFVVEYILNGECKWIECFYVVGCDGFYGVSCKIIFEEKCSEFECVYLFGWLGVLLCILFVNYELIYVNLLYGFVLVLMRNENFSWYYVQVFLIDKVEDWSDDCFWEQFKKSLFSEIVNLMVIGFLIEKLIVFLWFFVSELLCWGLLFLVGDVVYIVLFIGVKGLNLVVLDVFYFYQVLIDVLKKGDVIGIDVYLEWVLLWIWKVMCFSWQMIMMLY